MVLASGGVKELWEAAFRCAIRGFGVYSVGDTSACKLLVHLKL
jgi:hypothetical protein